MKLLFLLLLSSSVSLGMNTLGKPSFKKGLEEVIDLDRDDPWPAYQFSLEQGDLLLKEACQLDQVGKLTKAERLRKLAAQHAVLADYLSVQYPWLADARAADGKYVRASAALDPNEFLAVACVTMVMGCVGCLWLGKLLSQPEERFG